MTRFFLGIAIGISLTVITFQVVSIVSLKDKPYEFEKVSKIGFSVPLGLDSDGFPAACTDNGLAQSIVAKNGFVTKDIRYKDGNPLRCMNKKEALSYMVSQGADEQTLAYVLGQYPVINKSL